MQLGELSATSQTSIATIKFYLREDLLPPGRARNATRTEYGEQHLERLELIRSLRTVLGWSLAQIGSITRLIDDPSVPLLDLQARAQAMALAPGEGLDTVPDSPEHPAVAPLIASLGWSDAHTVPRRLLSDLLRRSDDWGFPLTPETLATYARAADIAARADVEAVADSAGRDRAVLLTVIGSHILGRLLVTLVATGQAARSVSRYADGS